MSYVSGFKWFVTFIDCHSRMIWIYLMKKVQSVQVFLRFLSIYENSVWSTCEDSSDG
jgi:hypothetical protein